MSQSAEMSFSSVPSRPLSEPGSKDLAPNSLVDRGGKSDELGEKKQCFTSRASWQQHSHRSMSYV